MKKSEKHARLLISGIEGIGARKFKKILKYSPSIAAFLRGGYRNSPILTNAHKAQIAERVSNNWVDMHLTKLEKFSISYVVLGMNSYPPRLMNIYDPPGVLYYKGNLRLACSSRCISIVGTRKMSPYGQRSAKQLGRELAGRGWVVVSGMALGVDCTAQQAVIENSGKTIAVLAGSVHESSPSRNRRIYEAILEKGLVVSEYPPGDDVFASNFIQRNRIISGLAEGVVVVEAGEKSGALSTARFALDEGREVFALPGSIFSPTSLGVHKLIQQGEAKLIMNVEDILNEFPHLHKPSREKKLELSGVEKLITNLVLSEPQSVDQIFESMSIPIEKLLPLLTKMELERKVTKDLMGKYYSNI
jgi:DNA processing protein